MQRRIAVFFVLLAIASALHADWLPHPFNPVFRPPVETASFVCTGRVTIALAATGATHRAYLTFTASGILPAGPTNTCTVLLDNAPLTSALTNGQSATLLTAWTDANHTLSVTNSYVTNLPSIVATYIRSPATTNIWRFSETDAWQLHSARLAGYVLPISPSNTIALAVTYAGWDSESIWSATNGAAAWSPSTPLRLMSPDTLTLTATRVSNSVPIRAVTERWR